MFLEIQTPEPQHIDLDALADQYSGVVSIGQKSNKVWNTIAIDEPSVDPFQCQLIGTAGGSWHLNNGQNRTECPKGLLSSRLVPCNGCTGRCVNIRAGRPRYYQHDPASPTLLNGAPVREWGNDLHDGDRITIGNVTIIVDNTSHTSQQKLSDHL